MDAQRRLLLALKMIAVARLYLHDVNIAASTALEALSPDGRLRGILAGANVVMPNVTPALHRADYGLYAGKPVCGEAPEWLCGLSAAGEHLLLNVRGDSLHFNRRTGI
jgi:biotin synthase